MGHLFSFFYVNKALHVFMQGFTQALRAALLLELSHRSVNRKASLWKEAPFHPSLISRVVHGAGIFVMINGHKHEGPLGHAAGVTHTAAFDPHVNLHLQ